MDKKQLQKEILESKYRRDRWIGVLREWFGVTQIWQVPRQIVRDTNDWREYVESAFEIGKLLTDRGRREVGIFEVILTDKPWIEINRVKLRNLLKSVYSDVDGALMVFVQDNKWRFSYVAEIRVRAENDEIFIQNTEPKRYTYLFGVGENCRTATDRFDQLRGKSLTLDDLTDAFSVEKLNKEFFKTYKEFFERFWEYLAESKKYLELLQDRDGEDFDKRTKPIRDFVKILLGRLVFLQFLQKKGWMGVEAQRKDWKAGDPKFIQNLFYGFSDKPHFHSRGLCELFFNTLNRRRKGDLVSEILGQQKKIPYLNGGLFDSDISTNHAIDFPPDYFRGLLDFFEQYNFTIDEYDPFDREVGIDPEMLGHIFENLLEENREKGAFYTPKEIVHYMCQESLIEYLSSNLSEDDRPNIELLVRHNQVSVNIQRDYQKANLINDLLKRVKICDPAIGSGAFPVGLLKEIFECRRLLFGFLKTSENFNSAEIKKEIIQNNIHGVDIEPGAIDIARLRFWLALIVDEENPQPLPNFDYKIMQGNSLLESFEDIDLTFEKEAFSIEKELNLFGDVVNPQVTITEYLRAQEQFDDQFNISELEEKYFDSSDAEQKTAIREKIERLEKRFIKEQLKKKEIRVLREITEQEDELERKLGAFRNRVQRENVLKSRVGKDLEKLRQELEKIQESKERLRKIKPNAKPYFLWHLYFISVFDAGGFDIVIGNPPYIKEYTDRSAFRGLYSLKYYQGKMDIWYFFACLCLDLLKPGGVECFIAQNNWITSAGASILRNKILLETKIKLFSDFGDYKVFQSAGIQTMIYLLKKINPTQQYKTKYRRLDKAHITPAVLDNFLNASTTEHTEDYIKFVHLTEPEDYVDGSIFFSEPWISEIIQDIQNNKSITYLWESEVAQGIVAPQDKLNDRNQKRLGTEFSVGEGIFQLSTKEREALDLTERELEIVKPFYSTEQLDRYYADRTTDEWIIYTKSDVHKTIKLYPNIKRHLEQYESVITSDFAPYGLHRARDEYFFVGEKIMSRRKTERPNFSYTDFDCYVSQTFFVIKTERVNLKYLTTVLNSKLIHFWLKNRGKLQGNMLQVDKEPLLNIPIKEISDIEPFIIIFDYLRFLHAKNKEPVNDFTDNIFMAGAFESMLNLMVYELYFEKHLKENNIDILQFVDTQNLFQSIQSIEADEERSRIIGRAYSWLQKSDNPVRNRIMLSNIQSPNIIRKINSSTN